MYAFSSNFQIAFNPQITKLHAVGDSLHLNNLVNKASLFSYYLMLLFAVPFMINTEIILKLWLKNVPEYTVGFCQLMVVYQLIDAFQAPLNTLIFSTGKIKNYNIWLSALIFCNIPLSLYLLSIGKSPYYVLGIRAGINLLTAIIRVVYVRYFMNFPSLYYFLHVVLKIFRFYMGENELEFRYWRFYSKFTYCNYNYRYSCVLDRNRKNRKEFLSFYSKKIPQDR